MITNLGLLRRLDNRSQADVARELGISTTYYGQLEVGCWQSVGSGLRERIAALYPNWTFDLLMQEAQRPEPGGG